MGYFILQDVLIAYIKLRIVTFLNRAANLRVEYVHDPLCPFYSTLNINRSLYIIVSDAASFVIHGTFTILCITS